MKRFQLFTLIELLIVISIIAILAALLLPSLKSAREKARQMTCVSNMKDIGVAFMNYLHDYDDFFPPYMGNNSSTHAYWCGVLTENNYSPNNRVYLCPSRKDNRSFYQELLQNKVRTAAHWGWGIINYGYNFAYLGTQLAAPYTPTPKIGRIKKPSRTVLVGESMAATGTEGSCAIYSKFSSFIIRISRTL